MTQQEIDTLEAHNQIMAGLRMAANCLLTEISRTRKAGGSTETLEASYLKVCKKAEALCLENFKLVSSIYERGEVPLHTGGLHKNYHTFTPKIINRRK
jgi:lambda repressor-like predicted transcriptional regulator